MMVQYFVALLVLCVSGSLETTTKPGQQQKTNTVKDLCQKSVMSHGFPGIPGSNGIPGIPGSPGPQGLQGREGAKGQTGDKGTQGMMGLKGERGRVGSHGKSGPRGMIGIKGERGPAGPSGMNGSQGMMGIKGERGPAGSSGRKGSQGMMGVKGERGRAGSSGIKGSQGMMGIKGERGPAGSSGIKGSQGMMGMKGERGPAGSSGMKGSQGMTGMKGERGFTGASGRKGDKGEKGESVTGSPAGPVPQTNWKQCVWKRDDGTDNGKIKDCSFNKLQSDTAIKVSFQGIMRVNGHIKCNRWYFKFNNQECSGPMAIEAIVYNWWPSSARSSNLLHPRSFEGYCTNLPQGTVRVELWVGQCSGYTLGDAATGFIGVCRIMIEEVSRAQS